jgi:hypothetical protein
MDEQSKSEYLTIEALRSGTVSEFATFLTDLNVAYAACYQFSHASKLRRKMRRGPYPFWELGLGIPSELQTGRANPDEIQPGAILELTQVEIHSPGFFEFLGMLNPLNTIREYLNDRHERRKDKLYREPLEREKLTLENELLMRQIRKEELDILASELGMMRDLGFDEEYLRQYVWQSIGQPLARLARHQDTKLIGRASNANRTWPDRPQS